MAASARSSTTQIIDRAGFEQGLEKLESKTAAGEFSPADLASPAPSIVDKLDDSKLEKGPVTEEITHRPTGFRVDSPQGMR
jgi:hypothetical protein